MEHQHAVLEVECPEPEGTIVRTVKPAYLTIGRLKEYWERLKGFNNLFNDYVAGDVDTFIRSFVDTGPGGEVRATGLIYEVDDVGLMFLTNLKPHEALAHFTFWDQRLKGREPLLEAGVRFAFEEFGFHRIAVEIPLYADKWLFKVIEGIGFIKEGRKREAVPYKGKFFDVNLYSVLRREVLGNGR